MARYRLRSPEQALPVRFVLGLYEFAASLKLAVSLILTLAAVLGWATFVESAYGLRAVHFGIYGSWWFGLLGAQLAVTIFSAATIRYPWKRYQTGFVITHLGLLTLLFGCLLSRVGGIDAQMPIFEDGTGQRAYRDTEHLQLTIHPTSPGESTADAGEGSAELTDKDVTVVNIPFAGGPFNWSELSGLRSLSRPAGTGVGGWLSWLASLPMHAAWGLAKTDQGVLYDRDNIRIEVVDYYSNSEELAAPRVKLRISNPRMTEMGAEGRERLGAQTWTPLEDLVVRESTPAQASSHPYGMGDRRGVGGGQLVFWMTGSPAELAAFLESQPDETQGLGTKGQVVLSAGGKKFTFLVEEKLGQPAFPLGESGLSARLVAYFGTAVPKPGSSPGNLELEEAGDGSNPERAAVELRIARGGDQPRRMLLLADLPELSLQDYPDEVFGSYWVDAGQKSAEQLLRRQGGSRIDILQGPDLKLYYRYWNRKEVVLAREMPTDGTAVDAFKMPIGQLKLKVDRHLAAARPGRVIQPVKFDKDQVAAASFRAAKLRMTVDGATEEFWLLGAPPGPFSQGMSPTERHSIRGQARLVVAALPLDEVDVGFTIRLRDFERKLDPGTSQPSHYSSWVDFLDRQSNKAELQNVFITMNAPVDFSDPRTGKSYRLFQEAFRGPFLPGSPIYEERITSAAESGTPPRDDYYLSILTVNYDPGRGVKYLGSLLVVSGIVTMFYMRAYFFKPAGRPAAKTTGRRRKPVVAAPMGV